MTSGDRRARERAQVQEMILAAARELFVRFGYEAVTMRAIASSIDYTPGALYAHFRDKADLVRALCLHDFGAFNTQLTALQINEADPIARICKMGRGYVAFAAAHPRQYEFMFMTKLPDELNEEFCNDPALAANAQDPESGGYAFLVQCVAEALAQGRFREGLTDKWLIAHMLWAGLHGVSAIAITFAGDPHFKNLADIDTAGREMRRILMLGMARDHAAVNAMIDRELHEPLTMFAASTSGAGGPTS
ncbi:MAG: TetR/AcrR family transcriptional regulator [Phycisphaerales bacterium]|jgi:AcrR family transcriptional regulator|nr:TetR/AcrR family transcriptional regulator [Phycisphaerales bacterium]